MSTIAFGTDAIRYPDYPMDRSALDRIARETGGQGAVPTRGWRSARE